MFEEGTWSTRRTHLTTVTDAALGVTTYGYDDAGNQNSVEDANHHTTVYVYDLAGRLASRTLPLNRVWTFTYDPDGNVLQSVDPIASATQSSTDYYASYAYDDLDRVSSVTYYDGSQTTLFSYDANNNTTAYVDGVGTATFQCDPLDRMTSFARSGSSNAQQITYTYDQAGNIRSRVYTDGAEVSSFYDDDGRLATMTTGGLNTVFAYDSASNLISTTLPSANGYLETRAYDPAGRLTEVKHVRNGAVLSKSTYVLDEVGNRVSETTASSVTTYTYDDLNRLTQACFTTGCAAPGDNFRRYSYDAVGNRLTEVRDTGTTTYTYDAADELAGSTGPGGAVTYTHDLDGRETAAGSATFSWGSPALLLSSTVAGTTTTYTYDGEGRRLQMSTGSQASKKVNFEWDPNSSMPLITRETDGSGRLIREYQYGVSVTPVSMDSSGKHYYFHQDGLGSVLNVTAGNGATEWTYSYQPFGVARTTTKNDNKAPANVLNYAGQYLDATGMYFMRARLYDPAAARFVSLDPVPPADTTPLASGYVYAQDNPILQADPSGRCLPQILGGAEAGGLIGALPGAAGGALAGFVLCLGLLAGAAVAAEVVTNNAQVTTPYIPNPGPPIDPDTGDQLPTGRGCTTWACRRALATLVAIFGFSASVLLAEEGGNPGIVGKERK